MSDTMFGLKRTGYCCDFDMSDVGKDVTVAGFVQRRRNLGNLLFIDLRDRTGIIQLAFDDSSDSEIFKKASACRSEFVIIARGIVRERESKNIELETGDIEIFVSDLRILSKSEVTPFEILETINVKEELLLKYRYLDLRRGEMQKVMIARHKIVKAARDYFDENGFLEIETPMLIKSTPEGARDFLVPSRVQRGSFYALPQSPQLYKQLLMLSGFDRYMQIVRCFRDEDLRADRQPEFTQIDLEMSFADEEDVIRINEEFIKYLFNKVLSKDIQTPFKRITYNEAMNKYGSDKPDTRFGLELCDLTDILRNSEFKVFSGAAKNGSIRAINAKNSANILTRKEIDKLTEFVKTYKAKGLAFTRITGENETSSYEKFLNNDEKSAIRKRLDAGTGDVILIIADSDNNVVFNSLGALRVTLAEKLNLVNSEIFDLLWITEFPLFEYDEEESRFFAKHHPFTSVHDDDVQKLKSGLKENLYSCRAKAYDLVFNGNEIGGGSVRINNPELQSAMFDALGFSREEAYERFGFLLDAFKYGVPPHCGMAYGLDRLVMLMLGKKSIRDVIAFPKLQNAGEAMTSCPSPVDKKQLEELGIKITEE